MATPAKKSPAADKRKEADAKQQERIASLQKTPAQAAASNALEERIKARRATATTEAPCELPFVSTPTPVAPAPGAAPLKAKVEKPAKEKKERKPREAKPKAEVPAVSDLVAKIEAKTSARIEKVHNQQAKAVAKAHAAEIKKLKAAHKAEVSGLKKAHKDALKALVPKQDLGAAEKKAYEAGVKAGEKAANKAIAAALKGR